MFHRLAITFAVDGAFFGPARIITPVAWPASPPERFSALLAVAPRIVAELGRSSPSPAPGRHLAGARPAPPDAAHGTPSAHRRERAGAATSWALRSYRLRTPYVRAPWVPIRQQVTDSRMLLLRNVGTAQG
jgi:hypothetical protein